MEFLVRSKRAKVTDSLLVGSDYLEVANSQNISLLRKNKRLPGLQYGSGGRVRFYWATEAAQQQAFAWTQFFRMWVLLTWHQHQLNDN
jgi:hypothetical protein